MIPDNVETWVDPVYTSACCETPMPESYVTATDEQPCPTCEKPAAWVPLKLGTTTNIGWFGWFCFPGCLPDSDIYGPCDTEEELLADMGVEEEEEGEI